MRRTAPTVRRRPPGSPFSTPEIPAPPVEEYAVGDRVSHDKYGLGRVLAVEQDVAVLIDFGTATYRVPAPNAKLVKL
ncbi:hypothetical protein SMD20_10075 [Nonomuraea sp. LP-02]|uniref:hypothetical protein n=1 Tax=Nonomuraea sp. LP-02 TaxID=3097960 RepID=UPI002E37676F|nr:hypothetical protein [Nonomuraea sp. LP-02]MED7924580.1 hypothetical protein [Nonomuraea sp. LP-02]